MFAFQIRPLMILAFRLVLSVVKNSAESCSSKEGAENVRLALYHKMKSSAEWLIINAGLVSHDLDKL